MKKELLIFGAFGALGRGVTETLLMKDYDNIFLFGTNARKQSDLFPNCKCIDTDDLSVEENVIKACGHVLPGKDRIIFMFSTVGGFWGGSRLWDTSSEDWHKMFKMNLDTNFNLAKHISKIISQSGGGSICFTAAQTGLIPESSKAAYGVSKSALIHLVKTLALEGRDIKLSVNAIAPYIIDTPANREWTKDADYSVWLQPKEIGNLIHGIFESYNFLSGNIIHLPFRFEINL